MDEIRPVDEIKPDDETKPVVPKKRRTIIVVIIIALCVLLLIAGAGFAWYYYQGSCGVNRVNTAIDEMESLYNTWQRTLDLAFSTSRIALTGPVGDMQDLYSETEDINVPPCLDSAKQNLLNHMDMAIRGFLDFMAQESDATVNRDFENSADYLNSFSWDVQDVQECAPFCQTP